MPGRREQNKAATRRALEQAAFDLFLEQGFDRTTVEDIATRAGVSARTFFRYFATKDDVLFGDHAPRLAAMHDLLAARPADEPVTDSIEVLMHWLAEDLEQHPQRVTLQTRVSSEKMHVLGVIRQQHDEMMATLAEFIRSRTDTPDPHEIRSRLMASAAMGAFLAAARWWAIGALHDDPEPFEDLLDEALAAFRAHVALDA